MRLVKLIRIDNQANNICRPIFGARRNIVQPDGFPLILRDLCDNIGMLLIADEVQTGLRFTNKSFGVQHWNGFRERDKQRTTTWRAIVDVSDVRLLNSYT